MRDERPSIDRYHRQKLLSPIGAQGQAKIAGGRATVVGCGALGTVAAELLVRAGVGAIRLIDRDVVDFTNLQRQVLFGEQDARDQLPKTIAASRRLSAINSQVAIEPIVADFSPRFAGALEFGAAEVIIDATDNFEARYLVNDLAVRVATPLVYAGAVGTEARLMNVLPAGESIPWGVKGATPCLRCVFPEPPEVGSTAAGATCDTVGVLGPVTAMIASMQAAEALKILVGAFDAIRRDLFRVDLWSGEIGSIDLSSARRDGGSSEPCPCCAMRQFEFLEGDRASESAALCGREAVQIEPALESGRGALALDELGARLGAHGSFRVTRYLVKGVFGEEVGEGGRPIELTVFADGRAIVEGTTRVERARSVYAKYVGA